MSCHASLVRGKFKQAGKASAEYPESDKSLLLQLKLIELRKFL